MIREAVQQALEALETSRRSHYYCQDTWYSCPKDPDGCANDSEGDECNCGADEINKVIDNAIIALLKAFGRPRHQPGCHSLTFRLATHPSKPAPCTCEPDYIKYTIN